MRLLLLSDLHLEFADLALPARADFDVAVLAGDIRCPGSGAADWVRRSRPLRRARAVIMVAGNHEFYDSVLQSEQAAMQAAAERVDAPPLHLLDCSQVVVDGVRFLGCTLWTDFGLHIDTPQGRQSDSQRGMAQALQRMADYRCIDWLDAGVRRRLRPQDTLAMHLHQRTWLQAALAESFDGPTVVITHHGPHRGSLAPRFAADWVSAAYLSELPASYFEVPVLWLHGHTHCSHDYRVGGCRVVCNPRGYETPGMPLPENTCFDPARVLQLDRTTAAF